MSNKSVLSTTPENTNFLQTTKYVFVIPELPFARYFCQSVSMPTVSTTEVQVETPFSATYRHGDKLIYDPLTIKFIIDEDMRTWEESYNWLRAITFPKQFSEYLKTLRVQAGRLPYFDGILTVTTNSNISNARIKFKNCHPTSLTGIEFDSSDSADTTLTAELTLRYDYFEFEKL